MTKIAIIGIAHILRSRALVDELITERSPDAVCVELDPFRYRVLIGMEEQDTEEVPFIIKRLADFQDKMAERTGAMKGEEMLSACRTARRLGARLYFIDPIGDMDFKDLFKSMGIKEKAYMVGSAVSAPFIPKKVVDKELAFYENHEEEVMTALEKKMPTLSKNLITNRNKNMAGAIKKIARKHDRIIAVVGDGHVSGIHEILKKAKVGEIEIIRLKQIRRILEQRGLKEGEGENPEDFSDLRSRESTINLVVHLAEWNYYPWR